MMITKRALPRRTVLRGLGTTLALPFLEAMVPALTPIAKTVAAPVPRLGFIYTPNGYIKSRWTPTQEGPGFELTPSLMPLAPYRDRLIVISGLAQPEALPRPTDTFAGPHSRGCTAWLTATHAKATQGADVEAGVSVDQLAANVLGEETPLRSLELGIERNERSVGGCEGGWSCIYANTISWRTPTTPLPVETDPRVVFERLFGDGASRADQIAQLRASRSILDAVTGTLTGLKTKLGANDRTRLTEYLDSVREVEARIQRVESQEALVLELPERPMETPSDFDTHVRLMFDLLVLAYQTDSTRVGTFSFGYELTNRAYPQIGVPDSHHSVSHHQGDPQKQEQKAKIDTYHLHLVAAMLEKLKNAQDGDATLLDNVTLVYGGGLGEPNLHEPYDLATLVLGGGGGRLKGGRHLKYPVDRMLPMSNLYVKLLNDAGVPIETFRDSNGKEGLPHL
jgi:hypothetical protein